MANKITKTMRNNDIIAFLQGKNPLPNGSTVEEMISHLEHENALIARKNNSDGRKLTKVQQENVEHKAHILEFLSTQTAGVTASTVANACNLDSNQKAAALLRALVDAGEVVKTTVKGKSLFSIANAPNADNGGDAGD